jgi:hypothetical protein
MSTGPQREPRHAIDFAPCPGTLVAQVDKETMAQAAKNCVRGMCDEYRISPL